MGFFSRGDTPPSAELDNFADESFSCSRHSMEWAEHICGECGFQFCTDCVVFPFGASKPPLCVACALERGGVRRQHRQKLSKRETKKRLEALRARRAEAESPLTPPPVPESFPDIGVEPSFLDTEGPDNLPGAWTQTFS